jgi:hypothetical protein
MELQRRVMNPTDVVYLLHKVHKWDDFSRKYIPLQSYSKLSQSVAC